MDDTKKTGPRDVFSHLLAIIFLYVSVFAFGSIVFSLIDIYLPDVLQGLGSYAREGLRWPLAVLVVVFPCYVWLTWYLARDVEHNPEKRDLRTRKWLLYFTLFATTIAIVIDLISLIFTFLNGELTTHFVLKVLTVFAIAAAVFTYYLWTIRKGISAFKHAGMRVFVIGTVAIVVLSIIFGFYVAGSPQSERLRRLDMERVSDLYVVQNQLVEYWRAKNALPSALNDLVDDINVTMLPIDPVTSESYEYRVTGERTFELCAVFQAEDIKGSDVSSIAYPYDQYGESFAHGIGRTCFERTIDPDRFPPLKSLQQ
ncbi:MAG: DUF5671 domain-containing protein [Patescibacteria group bacterium]